MVWLKAAFPLLGLPPCFVHVTHTCSLWDVSRDLLLLTSLFTWQTLKPLRFIYESLAAGSKKS